MPRAGQPADVTGRPGVIAGHLVAAESQREIQPPVDGRGVLDAPRQRAIEIGRLRGDALHGLDVARRIAKSQRHAVGICLCNEAARERLRRPGQRHAGAHHVEALHLDLIHHLQHARDVIQPQHTARGEDGFVVVTEHQRLVKIRIVGIGEAQRGQVDAGHRAMRARHAPAQVIGSQVLAGDGLRAFEAPGLQVARGQRADGIQRNDVDGRAQFVIFLHQR